MSDPLIFINTYQLKPGRLKDYLKAASEWFAWNQAGHPRLLHHEVYIDKDGTEVTNVQVHPDAASMEEQMQLIGHVHAKWQEYVDWSTMRILVCGSSTETLLEGMRQTAGSGIPVTIKTPLDGFTRLPSA